MQFHRDASDGINIISAFSSDGLHVNNKVLATPCVIAIATIIETWQVGDVADLSANDFQPLLELQPELIILGTGKQLQFPQNCVIEAVNQAGIGFEVMDTAAGCRTYNVLAHEGRKVALGLLAI